MFEHYFYALVIAILLGVGLIAFARYRYWYQNGQGRRRRVAVGMCGVFLVLLGVIPMGHEVWVSFWDGMAIIDEKQDQFVAEDNARMAKEKAEVESIRQQIAAMPMAPALQVYYLQKLDPKKGFLGVTIEATVDQAKVVLAEASKASTGVSAGPPAGNSGAAGGRP